MTTSPPAGPRSAQSPAGLLVALGLVLAVVAVALGSVLDAHASKAPVVHRRDAVAASPVATGPVVAPLQRVLAGQHRARAPNYDGSAVGSSVAAEDGAALSGRLRVNPEFGDVAVRNAARVPGESGVFDVVGHGTPSELGGMSASDVAGEIRGTPSWGGQDVRLLSCSTGCPTGSFAQDLANELGVGVRAPTTDIYVSSRGGVTFDPGGEWRWFYPAAP